MIVPAIYYTCTLFLILRFVAKFLAVDMEKLPLNRVQSANDNSALSRAVHVYARSRIWFGGGFDVIDLDLLAWVAASKGNKTA